MKIYVGSDHAGSRHKQEIAAMLREMKHEVTDVGTASEESVDYPDYAHEVAEAVADNKAERGILVCGTGIGMCIAANRHKGVRAAVVWDEFTAKVSRSHNNANVLCLGARVMDAAAAKNLVKIWLAEPFEGGRHERRVQKLG